MANPCLVVNAATFGTGVVAQMHMYREDRQLSQDSIKTELTHVMNRQKRSQASGETTFSFQNPRNSSSLKWLILCLASIGASIPLTWFLFAETSPLDHAKPSTADKT